MNATESRPGGSPVLPVISPPGWSPEAPSRYALPLRQAAATQAEEVGRKAANLALLIQAGFPVPDGFVLTTKAFERALATNGLGPGSSVEAVLAANLPDDVQNALLGAAASLGDAALAVRSSGVAEDLPGASFAGQYETVLGVRGADAIGDAVRRCWASAFSPRVAAYRATQGPLGALAMAVLVQRLVPADAAGVAFTANPVTGDRAESVVSAVRGLGERLVSGQATPDEWVVRGEEAACQSGTEGAIQADQVRAIAELARRVEGHFGPPQDIEWAIARGELFLLQARPMTALPEQFVWEGPLPGVWLRNFRLGEWIGDPVTPLFESWLLSRLEEELWANFRKIAKIPVPRPLHVVVNGWYFATGNFVPSKPAAVLGMMFRYMLPSLILRPRLAMAMFFPFKARMGAVKIFMREWRNSILPRYRAVVEAGEARVDSAALSELPRLVDDVADAAGDYFSSVVMVAGTAWKTELPLAAFYREHLYPRIGGSHQKLLQGLGAAPPAPLPHATLGLDWFFPTMGERGPVAKRGPEVAEHWGRVVAGRQAAEREAREALTGQPKLLGRFKRLLEDAQRFATIREECVSFFTLGWPLMRRAVLRLGEFLRRQGVFTRDEDVFFLTRDELMAVLHAANRDWSRTVAQRRQSWERQRRLAPPVMLGQLPPMMKRPFEKALGTLGAATGAGGHAVTGLAASPGRATGPARVIRRAEDFDRLQPGDVLVSPATTPAWTSLFARAAAVVTDNGSLAAHASLVAREYGIPAVVGTGDGTARLRDGQVVMVDGGRGIVDVVS